MRCWDARFRLRRVWSLELPAELLMLRVSKFGIWVEIVFSEFALTCPTSFSGISTVDLGPAKTCAGSHRRGSQMRSPRSHLMSSRGSGGRAGEGGGVETGDSKAETGLQKIYQRCGLPFFRKGVPSSLTKTGVGFGLLVRIATR